MFSVINHLVTLTQPYQGHARMTLTHPDLARARQLVWLVAAGDEHGALQGLTAGDTGIPAGRADAGAARIRADESAD